MKYVLDGIEGYVYEYAGSACPLGAVTLHRLYNASRHDTVVVPASEVAAVASQGYLPPIDPDLPEIIGCGFENVDSDGDGLIDGFERLIGSDIHDPDSDERSAGRWRFPRWGPSGSSSSSSRSRSPR